MDTLQTLQNDINRWQAEIETRQDRADFLRGECKRLVGESIDLAEPKANKARKERAEHLAELELIAAQLEELCKRLELAEQAAKEYLLMQAQQAYQEADQEARRARQALQAAYDERLHFMNRGGRAGETDETIEELKALEIKIVTAQAAARIATRNAAEAGAALQELRQ